MRAFFLMIAMLFAASGQVHACVPAKAGVGTVGCLPLTNFAAGTDYVMVWLPGSFPNSSQLINITNLFAGRPFNTPVITGGTINDAIIGGTTPNNGTFTNLIASATLSGAGVNSLLASPPAIGGTTRNTGAFTALSQAINTTWSGAAYPQGTNAGFVSAQTYTGTPTGPGFNDSAGHTVPLNLIYASSDQLNWAAGGGIVSAFEVKHQFGGGSTAGGRASLIIDSTLVGAVPATNANFSAFNIYHGATTNVTGAATGIGNGLGNFYATALVYGGLQSGVHVHEVDAGEWDLWLGAGSTSDYVYGLKFVNFSPNTWGSSGHAYKFESFLNFATSTPGTTATLNDIIVFGDPQAVGGVGFPGSPGGTMIRSLGGTTTNVIDVSAMTVSNAILLGPNNFKIRGDVNRVVTDGLQAANGSGVAILNSSGGAQFSTGGSGASTNSIAVSAATPGNSPRVVAVAGSGDAQIDLLLQSGGATGTTGSLYFINGPGAVQARFASVAAAVSYPLFTPAASGPIQISAGGTAANIILGTGAALATNAATGFIAVPTMAGAPTGAAGAAGQATLVVDTTNKKICYSTGGGTWECSAAFTP